MLHVLKIIVVLDNFNSLEERNSAEPLSPCHYGLTSRRKTLNVVNIAVVVSNCSKFCNLGVESGPPLLPGMPMLRTPLAHTGDIAHVSM